MQQIPKTYSDPNCQLVSGSTYATNQKIYIDIHLRNIKDADGYCSCDSIDDDDFVGRSPRSYTLEIDKSLSLTEMVSTTIHEMVHVKQYVFCELRDVSAKERLEVSTCFL